MPASSAAVYRPVDLRRTYKQGYFLRLKPLLRNLAQPVGHTLALLLLRRIRFDVRFGAVEKRYRILAAFFVTVYVGNLRIKQAVCLRANLVRGAVVKFQRRGTSAHVCTSRLP